MNTPICDFVRSYAEGNTLRLHVPGHKGTGGWGIEALDITEVAGADSLYEASGIILESEENASSLFGCPTFYSTEGSSHCIRAMVQLCVQYAVQIGRKPLIAAARNAHKAFLTAAALLDPALVWLHPGASESYLSCRIDPNTLEQQLCQMPEKPVAVYITSPDYLGNLSDISAIADTCHRHGCLLLVDNAHGAYLKFLPESAHPIDLGADICCDSAHKTLPVLTGGAYLHISPNAPALLHQNAKDALAMFGSTSPSYLILLSLDAANRYLAGGYRQQLSDFVSAVDRLKTALTARGYSLMGNEPLKLTLSTKPYGYDGREFARILRSKSIECEFADPDFLVMMLTPETGIAGLQRLQAVLDGIPAGVPLDAPPPPYHIAKPVTSVREAAFSPSETLPLSQSLGRIYTGMNMHCPPAVPVVVCGEQIDSCAAERLCYYGVEACRVMIESQKG